MGGLGVNETELRWRESVEEPQDEKAAEAEAAMATTATIAEMNFMIGFELGGA